MMDIIVYGAGAWGTALALSGLQTGKKVTLLARCPEFAKKLQDEGENKRYLPGIQLPPSLTFTADLHVLAKPAFLLLASPAQATNETITRIQPFLSPNSPIIICAKGIDQHSLQFLSHIIQRYLSNPLAVLSGPSFADEVANNMPTAVTVAADSLILAQDICTALRHAHLRCYASDDLIGVQVGGAVKNILAIASGILHGKNLGNNAAAALLTRGIAEIRRLGLSLGAKSDTFLGLSCLGDLILTSSSHQSRNFTLGYALGKGEKLQDILAQRHSVTEGIATAKAVHKIAIHHGVRMPICEGVYQLLHENKGIDELIVALLSSQTILENDHLTST